MPLCWIELHAVSKARWSNIFMASSAALTGTPSPWRKFLTRSRISSSRAAALGALSVQSTLRRSLVRNSSSLRIRREPFPEWLLRKERLKKVWTDLCQRQALAHPMVQPLLAIGERVALFATCGASRNKHQPRAFISSSSGAGPESRASTTSGDLSDSVFGELLT